MITLTDDATTKVGELIAGEGDDNLALRVAVRPGGCSGFSCEMFFDTERADDDLEVNFGEIRVVVDPSSAQLLEGATLDYKDGPNEAGFSIDNPNAQRTCGCGQSFSFAPSSTSVPFGTRQAVALRSARRTSFVSIAKWSTSRMIPSPSATTRLGSKSRA